MSKLPATKEETRQRIAAVHVLGCKVNQAEAASMARILEESGYRIDQTAAEPDLVLVNTCCVTSRAEAKSRRMVHSLAERYPTARIVVTGCLAEVNPSSLKDSDERRLVLRTLEKADFRRFIDSPHADGNRAALVSKAEQFPDLGVAPIPGRARAFLKVQEGCSQCCTYCIVPRARGRSRSLPLQTAIGHARRLEEAGVAEIVLTGIHLAAYGRDLQPGLSLEDLVERLIDACRSVRVRLSSIEPQELTDRLIELVSDHPAICRHFHIPLQSGDDAILRHMGRPYDSRLIRDLMGRIYSYCPDACVGMDVMVGFPGEGESAFRSTFDLIRELKPAYLHVFPFSPRPGTPAASYKPKVSADAARARVEELRALSASLRGSFYERFHGKVLIAVLEEAAAPGGPVVVRTDNYIPVRVVVSDDFSEARFLQVRVERLDGLEVVGSAIS
ncbi:MAG: tRNA (N(6)-L-threonylcarbamoyladenosine(37)-C(2))-methylthiotransferase MtaB [Desulfomonile sp.]|nr:tRNA (N(6)-L-threonylcarbamoyladenosine(37)-C(2))-methylthiotransferase MtaB [Desulfomonile sp.]